MAKGKDPYTTPPVRSPSSADYQTPPRVPTATQAPRAPVDFSGSSIEEQTARGVISVAHLIGVGVTGYYAGPEAAKSVNSFGSLEQSALDDRYDNK